MAQFLFAQLQPFSLAGSGNAVTDTSLVLTNMLDIDGNLVTMAAFGTIGYGTIQPDALGFEEQISFSGITQNANGTATLTGVKHVVMLSPYTETSGMNQAHPGGAVFVISNTSGFYNHLAAKDDAQTISGKWTFPGGGDANAPVSGTVYAAPTADLEYASKKYVDTTAIAGAPNANTTTKGIVQMATQAQRDAKTATGSTGASLVTDPSLDRAVLMHDYAVSSTGNDSYAITLTPAVSAYTLGDIYIFKADVANTGAATLNVNALGAKTILHNDGSTLVDNDFSAGSIVMVGYDGANMRLLGGVASSASSFAIQNSSYTFGSSATGNDSYAITVSPTPAAYVLGQMFSFKADVGNTGAATLNVNALGAKTIKRSQNVDLETGDILANQVVLVQYDGTNFLMLSVTAPLTAGITAPIVTDHAHRQRATGATYNTANASASVNYAHSLTVAPNWVRITAFHSDATTRSTGNYDKIASTTNTVYVSTGPGTSTDTTNIVYLNPSGGLAAAVISVDATNITLAWTKTSSPTGTAALLFEYGV